MTAETMEESPKVVSTLTLASQKISYGLLAFESKKAELEALAEDSKGLTISSIEDKDMIKIVSEKRKILKSERVSISKQGKEMRDTLTQMNRQIIEREKELIAIIEPTEKELMEQEKWVADEKERIHQEEIAKENARIQSRIDALAAYGFQIDYSDIKSMSDETFEKYKEAAKSQYEKEEAEKAEAERIRLEQEEKERLEREAERKRLEAERKELEDLRAKQAEAQRIIDEQNAKIAAEQKRMADEKARIEAERLAEIERKKRAEELKAAEEKAAEEARLKAIQDAKDAENARIEKERRVKEAAERKARRQPDKVKIQAYIAAIKAIEVPEMKTEDGQMVMSAIQELISRFDEYATRKADEL